MSKNKASRALAQRNFLHAHSEGCRTKKNGVEEITIIDGHKQTTIISLSCLCNSFIKALDSDFMRSSAEIVLSIKKEIESILSDGSQVRARE